MVLGEMNREPNEASKSVGEKNPDAGPLFRMKCELSFWTEPASPTWECAAYRRPARARNRCWRAWTPPGYAPRSSS